MQLEDGSWDLEIEAQTKAVIENIEIYLKRAGAGLQHVVAVTVILEIFCFFASQRFLN
jgi:enamine deaminase RidA (YjgF/YER057c/UK114 family)